MTASVVRLRRSRAQLVGGGARAGSVAAVMEQVFAVQAQDAVAAELGLRARGTGLARADVTAALETERSVVRGWFMRGTLHLVPAEDVRWLLLLYGERLIAGTARRYRELGLDEEVCARALRLLESAVADGPRTRAELAAALASGLGVDPSGQAPFHLIRRAALAGVLCHGPRYGSEETYVRAADWLPPADSSGPRDVEAAAVELARRYGRASGAADVGDFGVWSGLPKSLVRKAWAVVGGDAFGGAGGASSPGAEGPVDVRLLPAYDTYWLAWRDRSVTVPARYERHVWPGGGQIRAAVTADGLAVGTWTRGAGVSLFEEPAREVAEAAEGEWAAVRRFLAGGPGASVDDRS